MNILMLRHSAGFEYSYLPDAEVAFKQIGRDQGWKVQTTHRCDRINADNLAKLDVVIFATTGNLPFDEGIAKEQGGVTEAYAIQAGREVRVIVDAKKVSDADAFAIARNVAARVEEEMTFPGEIKVTVLREVRAEATAR